SRRAGSKTSTYPLKTPKSINDLVSLSACSAFSAVKASVLQGEEVYTTVSNTDYNLPVIR
ncbi:hypothetical protein LR032_04035, partial [Candidatus Bipolaricaulota bacterium]|nr:hypothetical protein [Candidatus Bipolaricaulota bacterium]